MGRESVCVSVCKVALRAKVSIFLAEKGRKRE